MGGRLNCVLRITELLFLAMFYNNRKESLLSLTHFLPTLRINGYVSKGTSTWICIFSLTLLHWINYNSLELPSDAHICAFHDLKVFWLLSIINLILQIRTECSEQRCNSQWFWERQICLCSKYIKGDYIKIFGLLLTSQSNASYSDIWNNQKKKNRDI